MKPKFITDEAKSPDPIDFRLAKFLELKEREKQVADELEELKAQLYHMGSFSTDRFLVVVEEKARTQAPALKDLIATYGDSIRAMCKSISYKAVKVVRK